VAEEYCWAITAGGGGDAAADQFSLCWSFGFSWASFYSWLCVLDSDWYRNISVVQIGKCHFWHAVPCGTESKDFHLRTYFYKLWDMSIPEGSTKFPEICERPQNSRLQKGVWFEARFITMNTGQNLNTKFTTTASFLGCSMWSMRRKWLKMKINKTALMNLVMLKRRVGGL